ncbi:hypothetical protein JEQ12_004069 [Ovis aries]|uniref:Uncharacterized protein n=1 Tax=Ovis aries TaxID=9940 RepID=A0A836A350_SHEEP|nr:hypothetical protein JEQ12_004069 [Ovis aries]
MKPASSTAFSAASPPLQSAPSLLLRRSAQRAGPLCAFCCQPPHLQTSLWLLPVSSVLSANSNSIQRTSQTT